MTKNNAFKNEKSLLEVLIGIRTMCLQLKDQNKKNRKIDSNMHFFVSKNIQNHSSNIVEYVGKKSEIMRHIEM